MSEFTVERNDILFPDYRGRLTEGVTYNPSNNTLIWVDIIQGEVHRTSLLEGKFSESHERLKFEDPKESIGAIGLTNDDNVIVICGKQGIGKGSFKTGQIEYFLKYNHDETQKKRLRSNDGIIDPWGHLWIGVMTDFDISEQEGKISPEGKLYRINCHDSTIETMVDNCYIPNGLAFSQDQKHFYWTDSLTYTIWKYDYEYISNTLSNKREHIAVKEVDAVKQFNSPEPDGLVMTRSGEIFSAAFSTSRVLHFDEHGKYVEAYKLPAEKITSVTIGGKSNDELYITTGHPHLSDSTTSIDPNDKTGDLGGFLFRYHLNKPHDVHVKHIWGGKL